MPQQRQLAAIMFTDMVSYTALMQQNEQRALELLKRNKFVLKETVAEHEGDIMEYYGDGSLCIFFSASEALNCAIQLQTELQKEPVVHLRIGIHIGEILFEEGKVVGDGINIASRLQSLGEAGSILFSREFYNQIRNNDAFKTVWLGEFRLKNVAEPMGVFALANDGLAVPNPVNMQGQIIQPPAENKSIVRSKPVLFTAAALLALFVSLVAYSLLKNKHLYSGKDKSIAVLPFKNISNDSIQEFFSDGITEDIITQISKIAGLKVISGTSVMQYKNTPINIKQIAQELGVATILEGSVRREGKQVRITAQLIDAENDQHIWADNYDRDISEVFAIQQEVAQQIASELNIKLTTDEGKRIQKQSTVNVAAYEDYLLARQSNWNDAEKLLQRAIQKDSGFALAWSSLAIIYARRNGSDTLDRPYYIRKSLDAALTALNLGPELSETHMIFGDILKTVMLNPGPSMKEFNTAIRLNPNNAEAYTYLAYALAELGRFEEAEKNLLKAKQLDPKSMLMKNAWMKFYYYSANADKLGQYTQELDTAGSRFRSAYTKTSYYFLRNAYDSMLYYSDQTLLPAETAIAFIKTGNTKQGVAILDSLIAASPADNAGRIGIIYAWLGDYSKAMEYLNNAYRLYDYSLISIKVDKLFEPLHNEPAFKNLLYRMGLEN